MQSLIPGYVTSRRAVIVPTKHPELGSHMQVMALDVIEPWVECFVQYGEGWWVDESAEEPVPDAKILTDQEYKALAKEYEDAILSLY